MVILVRPRIQVARSDENGWNRCTCFFFFSPSSQTEASGKLGWLNDGGFKAYLSLGDWEVRVLCVLCELPYCHGAASNRRGSWIYVCVHHLPIAWSYVRFCMSVPSQSLVIPFDISGSLA